MVSNALFKMSSANLAGKAHVKAGEIFPSVVRGAHVQASRQTIEYIFKHRFIFSLCVVDSFIVFIMSFVVLPEIAPIS